VREPRRPPSVDCSSAAIAARANKRRFVNLLQQLAGGIYRRWFSPTRAPDSENLDSVRALIRPVIQVMVSAHQKNAANIRKFNVFGERANLGIFYDQFECAPNFLPKEFRCFRAVAPPPASFVADLLSSKRRRKYAKCHRSIRLIQLREEFIRINELATVCLSDRLKEQALLLW